jgi:hypothetical protein
LNDHGGTVKNWNAIGHLITSPLFAVIICAGGASAIWFGVLRQPGGVPNPSLTGNRPTARRTAEEGRPKPGDAGSSAANDAGGAQNSQKSRDRIDALTGVRPKKSSGRESVEIEEFVAENEPLASSANTAATDRSKATSHESTEPPTSDTISPGDPRAKALTAYKSRSIAVPDDVLEQKRMAYWCDEQGLWDVAKTHWEAVLRLVPNNDEARKRLGFRWRGGQWVLDAASAEEIAQKKADGYWDKELKRLHTFMRCRTKTAVPARAEAIAQIEAVGDPRAATAIWNIFAADTGHHGMIVEILERFNTRKASQMLAAMAVYSQDKKAQVAAVAALRGRRAADYAERLVALMHAPLRVEERYVRIPGRAAARQLFVEGETANYNFLFSRIEAPTPESLVGWFQPTLSASEAAMARQFNQNQATMAKQALDQQVSLAKQMIQKFNDSIQALNQRVATVLNETCDARIRPDPEDGKRWLATALGTEYQPSTQGPKPTFTEIVAPLYSPSFLPTPVPC